MKITDVEGLVLRPGEVDATRADGEFPVTAAKRLGTILTHDITPVDGVLHVPGGPGLGIELDDDEVERRRVHPY
jgi:L-alanine-DL-glutamate epimerase-like enolase superfamily enzyme